MNSFNLGNSCSAPTQTRTVDQSIAYHPEEGSGPISGYYEHDLMIHHLQQPVYNVRPLAINPLGYPPNGTTCVAVGFGLDGVGGGGRSARAP